MKTSIATVSISGDLPEKLSAIAAAGYDAVEIFEQDFIAHDGGPREVGKMVRDHGLEIALFQPFRDFEGLPEPDRAQAFNRAKRKFELMQELGTDLILICSSVSPKALGGTQRAADDLAELGDLAAKFDVRIGFEALAWGRHVDDHRDAWEIVRRADHKNVGLILDSFHTLARKIDPETIRAIPGDKIFFVQLADAPLIEMDLLYWSRHFRNMPGEGDLALVPFMRAVAATGYDGPLSLEIFNDQFRGGSPRLIAVDGKRSLINLMDQVRRVEPDIKIDVPNLPERTDVLGFEYVEFAANEVEAENLGSLLSTLGFRKVGKHSTKRVDLWRQGEINIVVNTDPDGFAHTSRSVHGLTICDVGLKVSDAKATQERAQGLGAGVFTQNVGPGQLSIPAIRGVGGGLLRFLDEKSGLDQVWATEFQLESTSVEGAGLLRIDHIAQTMKYEEMLTWILFYTSIFNVEKSAVVDVVDPSGLVRSQVIKNAEASFCITINGADSHRTLAGQFVADSFGSSVQHIAFSTDDIFKTTAAFSEKGFGSLPISDNYYDDLAARFDLEPGLLKALKAGNILYDRDENGGELFQIYGLAFEGAMFFEVLERRDGYRDYGGPNAPYRIAAQKRLSRRLDMPRI